MPKFPKLCPRCLQDYNRLIVLPHGEYVCDQCITAIESEEVRQAVEKKMRNSK